MIDLSRRALVVGGAVALGTAAAAAAVALTRHPGTAPAPSKPVSPTSEPTSGSKGTPVPARTAAPVRFGDPTLIASLLPVTCSARTQQVERTTAGEVFMTQSVAGTSRDRYTTVVSRFAVPSDAGGRSPELDAMTIVDGGHALGLHIEPRADGGHEVWLSLQGDVALGYPDSGRLARFAYTPGEHRIDGIPGGVTYLPRFRNRFGEVQESIYNFDWWGGVAVERMYDNSTGHGEQYTRRRISDIVRGVDRPIGRMLVPVNRPTLQGFTTVGGSLFRWIGLGNGGSGKAVSDDPMAMEQFDWGTGDRVAFTPFPTLGQDGTGAWRDGAYEPEGCSVHRGTDGTPSLVVGVTVGAPEDHGWLVYELPMLG